MKKIFSWLAAAMVCTSISAQTLNETFEGEGFPPEDWSVIDGYAGYGWKKAVKGGSNCAYVQEVAGKNRDRAECEESLQHSSPVLRRVT